jgi:hypothetical protein
VPARHAVGALAHIDTEGRDHPRKARKQPLMCADAEILMICIDRIGPI